MNTSSSRIGIQCLLLIALLSLGCSKETPNVVMPSKVVAYTGSPFEADEHSAYHASDQSFVILMPHKPSLEVQKYELPQLGQVTETSHRCASKVKDVIVDTYIYVFSDFPDNLSPEKVREAVRDSFLGKDAELRKESTITHNGRECLECEMFWKFKEGINLTLRIFYVKGRVFVAFYGRSGPAKPDEAKRYLDSFKILVL